MDRQHSAPDSHKETPGRSQVSLHPLGGPGEARAGGAVWLPGRRRLLRRLLAAGIGTTGALALPTPALAADFPERAIRIVVNFPPGGPLDIIARLVSTRMTATLRQPVVVENVTGAAGNIGAAQVARASPDGYTLLLSIDTPFTLAPALNPTGSVNPADFRPIGLGGVTGSILAVNTALGVDSLQALIAKGRSELLAFASAGSGSPGHFGALMLAQTTGIKVNPIHYRGNAPAVLALVSGEVQAGILGAGGLLPQIKAGKVKAIAIASEARLSAAPEVPTFVESGLPGFLSSSWAMVVAPAATPRDIVDRLSSEAGKAIKSAEMQAKFVGMGVVGVGNTAAEAEAFLRAEVQKWGKVVREANVKIDQ